MDYLTRFWYLQAYLSQTISFQYYTVPSFQSHSIFSLCSFFSAIEEEQPCYLSWVELVLYQRYRMLLLAIFLLVLLVHKLFLVVFPELLLVRFFSAFA